LADCLYHAKARVMPSQSKGAVLTDSFIGELSWNLG
jgi:hypothetical protein